MRDISQRALPILDPSLGEMSSFKAKPPPGTDPIPASSEGASLYKVIRDDIIEGRLAANERLVVADLARRHGTSTNPVREALQLLRGEGFVIFAANRGARVRPIDQDFVRDIYEIGVLIEPALTRWFVNMATAEDIAELERIQGLIEENNFADQFKHSELDTAFHTVMYQRHYNRHAAELWWKHREILRAVARRFNFTLARRAAVMSEHRALITLVKAGEAEKAAELVARHVEGSGRHILEHMRARNAAEAG
jgi:DNA-binding GntR family transcriptional regulator